MISNNAIFESHIPQEIDFSVWHFTHVREGVTVGSGTNIGSHCYVGKGVTIGAKCRIQSFVYIPQFVYLGDSVFVGPRTTFTNDRHPPKGDFRAIIVEDGVVIGAGAIILSGVLLKENSKIACGAVVTNDTEDLGEDVWYVGNPAKPFNVRSKKCV